jgi:hypothetical protein
MSVETRINRIIAGLAIAVVLLILLIIFGVTLLTRKDGRPPLGQRSPVEALAYCGSDQDKLCVLSFTQDNTGQMLVQFQTPNPYYPEFILSIAFNGQENTYECERGKQAQPIMLCRGMMQVPGEVMQFKVVSKNWGTLLAEGRFAIIGIALATPEEIATATLEGLTGTPSPMPTLFLPRQTPTVRPTRTPSTPSYPNPSYPNPTSYP